MVRLHTVIDVPGVRHTPSARFWSQALGWPVGATWQGHPELSSFEPPRGEAYVHLQLIDGPARVHLDVTSTDPDSTVRAATDAGAQVVGHWDRWVSLRSPGGLPFCVFDGESPPPPEPVVWPDGHRSRLVQVCVDSPAARHDDEVAFWRSLLRGRWVDSGSAEFAGKWHDDACSSLQLLFQRLEEGDGPVRAHLDLGTDAMTAEVGRLVDLGAEDLGPGHGGWHVLQDPAGLPFCLTGNAPDRAEHRELS